MELRSLQVPSSARLRSMGRELRAQLPPIAQAVAAASLAYLAARFVPGRELEPTFAPIAAIVAMTAALGQRGKQTVLMVIGVTMGVTIANLLIFVVGTGTWQLFVAMATAMVAALLLRLGEMVVAQAGIWAILIVSIPVPDLDAVFTRLIDVGIGGGIALLFSQVLFPADPLRMAAGAVRPLLGDLASALEEAAAGLAERDEERLGEALARSEDLDRRGASRALLLAQQTSRRSPSRRRSAGRIDQYARAVDELRSAGRNAVVLTVASARLVRAEERVPDGFSGALDELAAAVRALEVALDGGDGYDEVERHAIGAGERLRRDGAGDSMAERLIAAQIESLARDVLRAAGREEREEAAELDPAGA